MSHIVQDKKKLLMRVRRIKGQVEAIETALNNDADCAAILQQVAAIRGAVNGLMSQILENHIKEHLGNDSISPKERKNEIEQVVSAINSYLK